MTATIQRWATMACAALLTTTLGCGGSNRAAVTGQVTLDGQPVEAGTISFIPADAKAGPSAWGEIKAGRYSIAAGSGPAVGANRVEVRWSRKTGKMRPAVPPAPASEEVAEAIPARYNSQSELKADIKPGKNPLDFKLTSK